MMQKITGERALKKLFGTHTITKLYKHNNSGLSVSSNQ